MENTITQLHNRITSVQNFISIIEQMKKRKNLNVDDIFNSIYGKQINLQFEKSFKDVLNYYPFENVKEYLTLNGNK